MISEPHIGLSPDNVLFLLTLAGFVWFSLLTIYYAVLLKKRAVVSMLASFMVAGIVTLWTTALLLVGAWLLNYFVGSFSLSWDLLFAVVELAYVVSVFILTTLFLFNQWAVRRMITRYRSLSNREVTRRIREMVDVDSMVNQFDVGDLEIIVVDDIEADAHTLVVAKPSLFSPKLGKDIIVVKKPLMDILEPDELEAVLAHELAHIEALDARFRPYFEVLGSVYFFDPVVQVTKNVIRSLHEYGADDRAVEVTGRPEALARALVKVADYEYEVNGLCFDVKNRVERLTT